MTQRGALSKVGGSFETNSSFADITRKSEYVCDSLMRAIEAIIDRTANDDFQIIRSQAASRGKTLVLLNEPDILR